MAEKPKAKWRINAEAYMAEQQPRVDAFHAEMRAKWEREAAEREAAYDARMKAVEEKAALEDWPVGSDLLRQYEVELTCRDLCREFLVRRGEAGRGDDGIRVRDARRFREEASAMVDARLAAAMGNEARSLDDETLEKRIAGLEAQLAPLRSEQARRSESARPARKAGGVVSIARRGQLGAGRGRDD